jgi:hydroxyacylglutathione hydrolase
VIHTPGHTLESSCYLLTDRDGKEEIVFTGDTLFLGDVGRPDLAVSSEVSGEELAGMLFDSLQKLRVIKPNVKVLPGHGSGSSCGKSIGDGNVCTLEKQVKTNYAFQIHSREEFIKKVQQDMPKAPQYFFYDANSIRRDLRASTLS